MEVAMAPSAPCSPRTSAGGDHHHLLPGYCYFFSSAPTSPSRTSCYAPAAADDASAAAFDFALGFSGQLRESTPPVLAAADELFEGGRIRPLNRGALPVDDHDHHRAFASPRRSRTTTEKTEPASETRGRSGRPAAATSRRATRSLSPFRGTPAMDDEDEFSSSSPPSRGASLMRGCGSGSSRKWRLKDLFLFRSASEGRATGGKDPLLKYTMLKATGGVGDAGSASMRIKGRGSAASASDMAPCYYTVAAAEETRRRRTSTTPLPFHRNSLFGYLRSNPAIHTISRKLGSFSSTSSRGCRPAAATANA